MTPLVFACHIADKGVPLRFCQLILEILLSETFKNGEHDLDYVDYFSGQRSNGHGLNSFGYTGISYDYIDSPVMHNILTADGFLVAVMYALCVVPGGVTAFAPVCSSWLWVARNATKRSTLDPLGDIRFQGVRDANKMVSRVVLLLELLTIMGVVWILEQPVSSLLSMHPRFQAFLLKWGGAYRHNVKMCWYGGAFTKPTWLYSFCDWWGEIRDHSPFCNPNHTAEQQLTETVYVDGKRRVTGKPNDMKSSQAYPVNFGRALAYVYSRHEAQAKREASLNAHTTDRSSWLICNQPTDMWLDAALNECFVAIRR
jgi:hypothetical protein